MLSSGNQYQYQTPSIPISSAGVIPLHRNNQTFTGPEQAQAIRRTMIAQGLDLLLGDIGEQGSRSYFSIHLIIYVL